MKHKTWQSIKTKRGKHVLKENVSESKGSEYKCLICNETGWSPFLVKTGSSAQNASFGSMKIAAQLKHLQTLNATYALLDLDL